MLNRVIRVTRDFTMQKAGQSAALAVVARDTINGFITTAHHALLVLGIAAIAALGIMFVRPEIADHLKALSPFAETTEKHAESASASFAASPLDMQGRTPSNVVSDKLAETTSSSQVNVHPADNRQQQWVTSWLSKRYRVASDATNMLVSAAYATAKEIKLDPLLILSVMAIESRFNPFAESPVGAQGLMQVMSKVHRDKFEELGGIKAALNPVANIRVGSLILKDYVTRGGSVEAGLKLYVGAGAMESDSGYGAKVLAEYNRLKDVAKGKNVPIYSTSAGQTPAKPRTAEPKVEQATTEAASGTNNDTTAKDDQIVALQAS